MLKQFGMVAAVVAVVSSTAVAAAATQGQLGSTDRDQVQQRLQDRDCLMERDRTCLPVRAQDSLLTRDQDRIRLRTRDQDCLLAGAQQRDRTRDWDRLRIHQSAAGPAAALQAQWQQAQRIRTQTRSSIGFGQPMRLSFGAGPTAPRLGAGLGPSGFTLSYGHAWRAAGPGQWAHQARGGAGPAGSVGPAVGPVVGSAAGFGGHAHRRGR